MRSRSGTFNTQWHRPEVVRDETRAKGKRAPARRVGCQEAEGKKLREEGRDLQKEGGEVGPRAEQSADARDAARPPSGPLAWLLRQEGAGRRGAPGAAAGWGPGRGAGERGRAQPPLRAAAGGAGGPPPGARLAGAPRPLRAQDAGLPGSARAELEGARAPPANRGRAWVRIGVAPIPPRAPHYERRGFAACPRPGRPAPRGVVQILS